jgi:cytidylate kinase
MSGSSSPEGGSRMGQSGSSSPEGGSRMGQSGSSSPKRRSVVVAIDGPAGSGKSTVARALASRLGVPHVDTGAFYRAAALAVMRAGVPVADGAACAAVVATTAIGRQGDRTLLDGEDVEAEIRGPSVTGAVSAVAAHPAVRSTLLAAQRAGVSAFGGVVEGRDAGTVVVPAAPLKVWLTATPLERAARRAAQLGHLDPAAVARHALDLARRDEADAAQMVQAPDVLVVDTTGRSVRSLVDDLAAMAVAAAEDAEEQA